jgi:hypothetical protein
VRRVKDQDRAESGIYWKPQWVSDATFFQRVSGVRRNRLNSIQTHASGNGRGGVVSTLALPSLAIFPQVAFGYMGKAVGNPGLPPTGSLLSLPVRSMASQRSGMLPTSAFTRLRTDSGTCARATVCRRWPQPGKV